MKDFKNKFLSLLDDTTNQVKSVVDSVNDMVNSFDWDAQVEYFDNLRKKLVEKSNSLYNDFTDLLKQVKESLTDFSVTVPFDEAIGEKLAYEVKDGKLVIEVTYSDEVSERSNKTSVLVPDNCDLEKISHTVNAAVKTATITIPKVMPIKNDAEPIHVCEESAPTYESEEEKEAESAPIEETEHISRRLADRLQRNMAKRTLHRDAMGRFVRRESTNN